MSPNSNLDHNFLDLSTEEAVALAARCALVKVLTSVWALPRSLRALATLASWES